MTNQPIELLVTNTVTYIRGKLDKGIYQLFKKHLGYKTDDAIFRIKSFSQDEKNSWASKWDGVISTVCFNKTWCKCAIKRDGTHFPTGLLSLAREFFDANGIPYKRIDRREVVGKNIQLEMSDDFEQRDYQLDIVNKAVSQQRGIIKLATGGGKTSVAANIIKELSVSPFIFYVPSIDLLQQAHDELSRFIKCSGFNLEVGIIGNMKCDIKDVNIMTVQTAVRALGEKWKKFDKEEHSESKVSELDDNAKKLVKDLIMSSKGMICDEVQHWASETCQIISDYSMSAKYRYGMSATPFRDKGDDILINACFGKVIADVNASFLIDRGYLVPPTIYFVKIDNMKGTAFPTYEKAYKSAIVENGLRNSYIANIANGMKEQGKVILILCRHIAHGKMLSDMIEGSEFLHGSWTGKKRKKHLDKMRNREASVTIASSLPYGEWIYIRDRFGFIRQIEIGDFCENYSNYTKDDTFETLCSLDGKTTTWRPIIQVHKHLRKNNVFRVITDKKDEVYVTENHSLVDENLNQTLPQIDNRASCPVFENFSNTDSVEYLDLLDLFSKIDDDTMEVEILGISQGKSRTLKSDAKYIDDKKNVCKDTRIQCKKRLSNVEDIKLYREAIRELFNNFSYYKYKYRAKLKSVCNLKNIFKYFDARIYIRRSRKNFSLPITLPITESLAIISGLMIAEGHIKYETSLKSKSQYHFTFTSLVGNKTDGRHDIDKRNIRKIFCSNFKSVFGNVYIWKNNKQINCHSKLLYYLFKSLSHITSDGEKRIPDYIFNSDRKIQEAFLWGFYLGDGSKKLDYRDGKTKSNSYSSIIMINTSRPFICGLTILLKMMNLRYYIYKKKSRNNNAECYYVNIIDEFYGMVPTRLLDKVGSVGCDRIQLEVDKLSNQENFEYVYDISVDGAHNFIAGIGGVLCHNTIFDEGIDCRPLDTLILAGSGISQTRALQRVGRTLRPYPGKTDATIIDFEDNCKYMLRHSRKRKKIYQTEPRFNIKYLDI